MSVLEWIFWGSVSFVLAATAGYPLMISAFGLFIHRARVLREDEPTVSLIIAAHNEERVIREKIENSLALDYPGEKFEIMVASDGSTDRTNEIVRSFADKGIKLCAYERRGKTGIQNETVKEASGEILVFSDANAFYRKDAIRKLVRNFGDDQVGCVSGQLVYRRRDECGAGESECSYWSYEKYLKCKESALFSLVGANGSIYAIRKKDYVHIGERLISDFVEPLEIVRRGKRVIYEPEAVSEEEPSLSYEKEFRRKVRILTRSIQGLLHMKGLLNPFRYGIFSLQLLVHKAFRYLIPGFLLSGALSLLFLSRDPFYFLLCALMMISLLMAAIARAVENTTGGNRVLKLFNLIYYYVLVNLAVALAWVNVVKGSTITVWATDRNKTSQ